MPVPKTIALPTDSVDWLYSAPVIVFPSSDWFVLLNSLFHSLAKILEAGFSFSVAEVRDRYRNTPARCEAASSPAALYGNSKNQLIERQPNLIQLTSWYVIFIYRL